MYKCGWSPLEGTTFQSKILMTFVNGNLVFDKGVIFDQQKGMRLEVI
jgi:dihydroorotase